MAKKDKKSKSAEQKARVLAKQSKKATKGEKKTKAKAAAQDADSDADDDVDLDAVLAAYAAEQARFLKVTEQTCDPPSARSSCTIIASPSNRNELLLFGGEFMDSSGLCHFYNDLFIYNIARGEYSHVTSPNSPPPRSGHAWCRNNNTGRIYMGFGEFSSPKQGIFYHFNSMYQLDPESREWTLVEPRGKGKSPPARSGHRITSWKNFIILFGGFQDTSQQTRYLNDTWIYDCKENIWHEMKAPPASQKPDARSSFSFLPHESGAVLYGGYSRVKTTTTAAKHGKGGPQRNILKPVVHQDTWFLRITPTPDDSPPGTAPGMRWERRKKPANAPNPARAGSTMAFHKGRGVFFGGVHDVEESEEGIESEFFNELYIWNIDRNRFFPLALRRPKTGAKKQIQPVRAKDRGKADEEELLRNLAALEAKGSLANVDDLETPTVQQPEEEIEPPEIKRDVPVRFEMPHPRFNAQLTVQDDTLYIFGGTVERRDIEITFSDLYAIDLGKLDGVKELHYVEPLNWNVSVQVSDDEDDEDGEEDEDESDAGSGSDEDGDDNTSVATRSTAATELSSPATTSQSEAQEDFDTAEAEAEAPVVQDSRPFPRPFESLRDFYSRTSEEWQKIVLDLQQKKSGGSTASEQSIKELRKKAFEQAEERWWDVREEILTLEDEQEASGIGEVVSLADRTGDGGGGGVGRRR